MRKVLVQSANDNATIKRAENLTNYLKVLSDDKDFSIVQKGLHEEIKTQILSIGKRELKSADIEVKKSDFTPYAPAEPKKITPMFRIITRNKPKVGAWTEFYCLSAGCNQKEVIYTWSIEGESYGAQKISHRFQNPGRVEVRCEVTSGGESYRLTEVVHVL